MKEINVEYDGRIESPAEERGMRRGFGIGALAATAAAAVAVALLLALGIGTLALPGIIEKWGYVKKSDIQTGISQNVTIESNGSYTDIEAVVAKVGPSVVGVTTTYQTRGNSFFFFNIEPDEVTNKGAGVVMSSDGYILTSYHLIAGAIAYGSGNNNLNSPSGGGGTVYVTLGTGENAKDYEASIVGCDGNTDLAVLKIDAEGLIPAEAGGLDELKTGQYAAVVGRSAADVYAVTASAGCISVLYKDGDGRIRTDAVVTEDAVGGAIADMSGRVIGICCIASENNGFGTAIPMDSASRIYQEIVNGSGKQPVQPEQTDRPADGDGQSTPAATIPPAKGQGYLGVKVDTQYDASVAEKVGLPAGARVAEVLEGLAAEKAGLRDQDIITKLDGRDVDSGTQLIDMLKEYSAGDTVKLTVWRSAGFGSTDGETTEITVVLGTRPEGE